jgi:hypothetical protein
MPAIGVGSRESYLSKATATDIQYIGAKLPFPSPEIGSAMPPLHKVALVRSAAFFG